MPLAVASVVILKSSLDSFEVLLFSLSLSETLENLLVAEVGLFAMIELPYPAGEESIDGVAVVGVDPVSGRSVSKMNAEL